MTSSADRIYLYVVPEERTEAIAAGALWDEESNSLYIAPDMPQDGFAKWLADSGPDDEFAIVSSEAYVATASTACCRCRAQIEIICIYCDFGTDLDEPLMNFTVSNISSVNEVLSQQLRRWPNFRKGRNAFDRAFCFANYCPNCNAAQRDMLLHDEPDAPFFAIPEAPSEVVHLIPLSGLVRLSGDCHFAI